MKTIHFLARLQ